MHFAKPVAVSAPSSLSKPVAKGLNPATSIEIITGTELAIRQACCLTAQNLLPCPCRRMRR